MSIEAELHSPFAIELRETIERDRRKLLSAKASWLNNLGYYEARARELREAAARCEFDAAMAREELALINLQLEKLT